MPTPGLINPLNRSQANPPVPNLLSQIPAEQVVRPAGFLLSFLLDALVIGAAVLTSWLYSGYLAGVQSVWYPVGASALFILLGLFPLLFTKSFSRRMVVHLLEVAGLLSFFWQQPFLFLFSTGVAAYFFLFWGDWASRRVFMNSLTIRFGEATHHYINKATTGLVMVAVLLFLPQWQAEQSFLSRDNFQSVYDSASEFAGQFYPELRFDGNFGEFAESAVRLQFAGNLAYEQLLPPAKAKAVEEAVVVFMNDIQKDWGFVVPADRSLSQVTYDYLIHRFEEWRGTFGERFLAAWAIVTFFILRSFAYAAALIITLLGYFAFQLLLALNVVHIRGETGMREVIEYS